MRAFVVISLLLAGCAAAPVEEATSETSDVEAPQYEIINVTRQLHTPVDWSGHTLEGVWLCDVPQCPVGHVQPSGAYRSETDYAGTFTNATLHLEWTPADATQTGLALQVRDGPGGPVLGLWQGASSFDVELRLDGGNGTLAYAVWPVAKAGNTFVDATQQPFTLSGTITGTVVEQEERLIA